MLCRERDPIGLKHHIQFPNGAGISKETHAEAQSPANSFSGPWRQKLASNFLELESQVIVRCHVGAGNYV